jgi:dihydroorotate dehydrogenase electron transfer subunit
MTDPEIEADPTVPRGPAGRSRLTAVVQSNTCVCREHYLLRVRLDRRMQPTRPGQFVQVGCRPPLEVLDETQILGRSLPWTGRGWPQVQQAELCASLALLRRPLSIAGRHDDAAGTSLEFVHRVVGQGTAWLAGLRPGDVVDLLGPLGNGFGLPGDKAIGVLVGGGVGLPPMFYLARLLRDEGWQTVAVLAARSRDLLPVSFEDDVEPDVQGLPMHSVSEFARLGVASVVTTDDGSCGLKGLITDGLEKTLAMMGPQHRRLVVVFCCGPTPMMRATARLAEAHGVACQACLEQAMACGLGTCQSCVMPIRHTADAPHGVTADGTPWRYRLTCTEGPVFDAKEVIWG